VSHLDMCGTWKRGQGHEWKVHVDDGSSAVVHRTELVLAPATVTEETLEAARQGRRKQTNRDHSVRPPPHQKSACAMRRALTLVVKGAEHRGQA
jgi:hypothetical protein